ncbi:hypothetical protein Vretimale_11919, partial [Volvox reticuliferus]
GNSRPAPAGSLPPAGGNDVATIQGLRRYTAAQLHQLSVVRQIQLRQQAATTAEAQQQHQQGHTKPAVQTKAEQQAQVLAAAAEVAHQVAARKAASAEQQRQNPQHEALAAADQRLLVAAAPGASGDIKGPNMAAAHSTLYKRASAGPEVAP